MVGLFEKDTVALFDLSNFVARAASIAGDKYITLFCDMIRKQRVRLPNHRFVFAVEGKGTQRRQRICDYYKANRSSTPEFNVARQQAIRVLQTTNCEIIQAPDGEADDAIATYVHRNPNTDFIILSNDRDLWQLTNTKVKLRCRVRKSNVTVDKHFCKRHLGVPPEHVPLLKAILGDPSDEIPRAVPRIKEASLIKLVNAAGDASAVKQATKEADWLNDKEKVKILDNLNTILRHERLTKLDSTADLVSRTYTANKERFLKVTKKLGAKIPTKDVDTIIGAKL